MHIALHFVTVSCDVSPWYDTIQPMGQHVLITIYRGFGSFVRRGVSRGAVHACSTEEFKTHHAPLKNIPPPSRLMLACYAVLIVTL